MYWHSTSTEHIDSEFEAYDISPIYVAIHYQLPWHTYKNRCQNIQNKMRFLTFGNNFDTSSKKLIARDVLLITKSQWSRMDFIFCKTRSQKSKSEAITLLCSVIQDVDNSQISASYFYLINPMINKTESIMKHLSNQMNHKNKRSLL